MRHAAWSSSTAANRLNVAISRARCAAFLVANPALFDVRCRSERQMALANAFCRYLEIARSVTPGRADDGRAR